MADDAIANCYICTLLGRTDQQLDHEHGIDDLIAAEKAERQVRPYRSKALWALVGATRAVRLPAALKERDAELGNALATIETLKGVIARAIEAGNSIADRDAEDAIQEMLQHLLEAEPEGHDDRIEQLRAQLAESKHEADLLREQLDLVLRRLGWDGEATNECPYEHGDEVARALLEDRDADARRAQSVIAAHSEETSVSERLIVTISASYIPDRGWEVRDNGGTKDVQWLSYAGATAEIQKRVDHYRNAGRSVIVMRDGKEIAAMVIE
jgi:uncharacterized coiled-coil protein SlyX